jgi:hypothetical protein
MRQGGVQDGTGQRSGTKVTVYEAADILGVTVDALRKRIQRGTIPHERRDDGRVYVLLDASSTLQHEVQDGYQTSSSSASRDEMVESLQEQVRYLREILNEERDARRRADMIIAQITQTNAALASRVPELEPAQEPRESSQTASEDLGRGDPEQAASVRCRRG